LFPDFGQATEIQILTFALVMLRMVAFVFSAPLLSSANIPIPVKVLLSVLLAVTLVPSANLNAANLAIGSENIILLALREIFIGLFLGFLMRMFFFTINVAGELISISMGLSSAQIFNPALGSQSNVIEQLKSILATLLFFGFNGHHFFLLGMSQSLELLPIGNAGFNVAAFASASVAAQTALVMGLKMSAPVMVAVFLANLSMGVLGRAVPQINVLVTSLTVTISVGFVVMILAMPLFINDVNQLMHTMVNQMVTAMRSM
jgi:flagellar biosynthetic protein FliR